jgi:hypothetical protein
MVLPQPSLELARGLEERWLHAAMLVGFKEILCLVH